MSSVFLYLTSNIESKTFYSECEPQGELVPSLFFQTAQKN